MLQISHHLRWSPSLYSREAMLQISHHPRWSPSFYSREALLQISHYLRWSPVSTPTSVVAKRVMAYHSATFTQGRLFYIFPPSSIILRLNSRFGRCITSNGLSLCNLSQGRFFSLYSFNFYFSFFIYSHSHSTVFFCYIYITYFQPIQHFFTWQRCKSFSYTYYRYAWSNFIY